MRFTTILTILIFSLIMSACGGNDGSTEISGGPTTLTATSGVVVDPYIVNAVVQENDTDGNTVQSATTNTAGEYSFNDPLTVGSALQLKAGSLGQHAGSAYTVILRRVIRSEDTEPVVVSPLTTLIADGSTPAEVVQVLASAGLTGLTEDNLFSDPMAGLSNLTNATDDQLKLLQASMAVGSYLEATTANGPTPNALTDSTDLLTLGLFASSVQATLNATNFAQVASDLADDPTISTLTVGDFIQAAVIEHQSIVTQVKTDLATGGSVDTAAIDSAIQMAVTDLALSTKNQYQQRLGQTPGSGIDGQLVFTNECDVCHDLSGGGVMDLSGKGSLISDKLAGGHNGRSLTAEELQALTTFLDGTTPEPPVVDPTTPPNGTTLYANNCATCHGNLANSNIPGRTAAQIQSAINNVGSMGSLSSLSADEVQAIADVLPAPPVVDPTTPPDGTTLYANNCAACHSDLANTTKPGRTAAQIQGAINNNVGNMGGLSSLTADEIQAIADVLPAGNGGIDYSDCTACHSQPPDGTDYPNTAGAHAAHRALPGVGTDCSICHLTADHNGNVDLAFPADYDAKSGLAIDNLNGTCSNISCHGGQTTPDWWTGSIDVNTQCTSCHTRGTSQYNSQNSGQHGRSEHRNRACTDCHNTAKMTNHFGDLATPDLETDPAGTVGGGSTRVGSYSNGTCSSIECHGSKRW